MEKWEEDLRAKLQAELPDGPYNFGTPVGLNLVTGKGGAIEFEVAVQKEIRKYIPQDIEPPELKPEYRNVSYDKLKETISKYFLDNE